MKDDAEVEQLPATEEAGEQAAVPEVLEEEVYTHLLKEMPDGLPLPNVPRRPSWCSVGWGFLTKRSMFDMIWARWFPPEPSNYAGMVRPCNGPAGLGEVNDEELNRLDWELEKGFNEALQSEKDFMDGVRVGFLKNMTKLPFNLAGFVLNSREVQDMPEKLESSDVEDEGAYLGGKITADVVTTVLGIIGIVSGVGQMVTGLAGDVGGGALCASGVGIPAGVAVVAGSTTLVVAGAAEVAASASLVYSSVSNFGRDVDELKESKEKKETTSPEESEAAVENDDKTGTIWDKITSTSDNMPGTELPATFKINLNENISYVNPETGTNTLWTNSNATKHMGEYLSRFGEESGSIGIRSQVMLENYSASLNKAMETIGKEVPGRYFGTYGNWELGINTKTGVVYHARMLN